MVEKDCPTFQGYTATDDAKIYTHRKRFGLGQGNGGGVRIDNHFQKELGQYIGHGGCYESYSRVSSPNVSYA